MKRRGCLHRLLRLLLLLAALAGLAGGVLVALLWMWVAKPPPNPAFCALTQQVVAVEGDVSRLGPNWFGRRDGLPVLYLTGTPFEMGYANGALTQSLIRRQEDTMVDMLNRLVPLRWVQFLLKVFVTFQNRDMDHFIAAPFAEEMTGLIRGCPDSHPDLGPYYNRVLSFHAAQDISYMLMNSPLIRRACTGFGAWGRATTGGRLIAGRNFDWEAAPVFDEDRIVVLCEPADGIPFVSLAWAGMAGCVSGLNREGLAVFVNGAPSDLPRGAGTPTCLVAREILQHARTIDEAFRIAQSKSVFVSAFFLVGSRADGRFAVIEKTPSVTAVREAVSNDFIVSANHYLSAKLRDTPLNREYMEADTSLSRQARAEELLAQWAGRLDPAGAAAILRDRLLPGARFCGNGNRGTLNPLIATHSAVANLTEGLFWASSPPHQLGRFVAFDAADFSRLLPDRVLPEDPMRTNGQYQAWVRSREDLRAGWASVKASDAAGAKFLAQAAEFKNPGYFENSWLLGEALLSGGKTNEGIAALEAAIERGPAYEAERKKIAARIGELKETSP